MSQQQRVYKVIFISQGKTYELYARQVGQGSLYGFVEVEELLFGEKSGMLVDPSEERLKDEFGSVRRTYIPIHSVVRIDQVEKVGSAKIRDGGDKVTPFPGAFSPPGGTVDGDSKT